MKRALLLVLDSLGVGATPDAGGYGDAGANTLGHIADWCQAEVGAGGRGRSLHMPQAREMGLGRAALLASGVCPPGLECAQTLAAWGCAAERSTGKDSVSGHWELCGLPVEFSWGYFDQREHSVPAPLLHQLSEAAGCAGVLGNCHASGTEIIARLGEQHLGSGWPIVYTSADSVLQIAAHEQQFGLQRLYDLCQRARVMVDRYRIGRVIARPFLGSHSADFKRTPNRRDWTMPPSDHTLLDSIQQHGGEVIGVGKIDDLFAGHGISRVIKAQGLDQLMQVSAAALAGAADGALVFTNLVDFDQEFGHRRDVAGYARALEHFDTLLGPLLAQMQEGDLLILTADHGNDPTWPGSDHTREYIPLLVCGRSVAPICLGRRSSFADVGQSLASWLHLPPLAHGQSFL